MATPYRAAQQPAFTFDHRELKFRSRLIMQHVLISSVKFARHMDAARDFLSEYGIALIEHDRHRQMDEATLLQLVPTVAGLIAGPERVTEHVMAAAPQLQVVCAPGVGYDHIDVEAATRRGIVVCTCPGCNHHAVAEMALGMLISLARNIGMADRAMRQGRWSSVRGVELWGKTMGIVGLGNIGKSLALRARALGMRVLAMDSVRDITFASAHEISYVPLATLLRESDVVSLHCPLTPRTRGLINARTLALMKPTAYLINTARGPLVEQAALVQALRAGRLAGAGLDVFETEPLQHNPFTEFENVVLTPHCAGGTQEAVDASLEVALQNVVAVLNGQRPVYRVT
jgi:D-3-phosphoglycerate dehydrogenase